MALASPSVSSCRHPILARPVPTAQLVAEFDALWSRCRRKLPRGPRPSLRLWGPLGDTHQKNHRRYAEVDVARRVFYFAPQILRLPRANRIGLLSHELGHLLAGPGEHTEDEADEAAFQTLGVSIGYDRRWPGKGLQTT